MKMISITKPNKLTDKMSDKMTEKEKEYWRKVEQLEKSGQFKIKWT